MRYLISSFAICIGVGLTASASADELVLKDGQTFEGVVTEANGQVHIQLDIGTVSFDAAEVKEIRRSESDLHELRRRHAALSTKDVRGRLSLATWAQSNGFKTQARRLYQEVLALEPASETAHRGLGHRFYEGRWLDEAAYMRATGHVRYGGQWMAREDAVAARIEQSERVERRRAETAEKNAVAAARSAERSAQAAARANTPAPGDVQANSQGTIWAFQTGLAPFRYLNRTGLGGVGFGIRGQGVAGGFGYNVNVGAPGPRRGRQAGRRAGRMGRGRQGGGQQGGGQQGGGQMQPAPTPTPAPARGPSRMSIRVSPSP